MNDRPLSELLGKDPDPRAVDEVWHRIEARRRGGRGKWVGAAFALVACVVMVLLFRPFGGGSSPLGTSASAVRLASGAVLPPSLERIDGALTEVRQDVPLDDGSHLLLEDGAKLVPRENTGKRLAFELSKGAAVFDVKPNGPREWSIEAGLARVSVLGTRFRVVRGLHVVKVEVERGHVLVTSARLAGGEAHLHAGQWVEVHDDDLEHADAGASVGDAARFDDVSDGSPAPSLDAPTNMSSHAANAGSAGPSLAPPSAALAAEWRPFVAKGDYHAAYEALGHEGLVGETKRASSAADLLVVADVARLSGHPRDAVEPLERLLAEHGGDARAPASAFTLGKIQLDSLGEPARAARAFERAISGGLPSALREDAFARRVEAYAKSGNAAQAKSARVAYDESYPTGRHRAAVEGWAP